MTSVLQPPPFRKRRVAFMAHHDMVQDTNIHQAQRFLKPLGNAPVGIAGLRITTGVVMHQNDSGGVVLNGVLDDLAWIDTRGINRAPKQLIEGD